MRALAPRVVCKGLLLSHSYGLLTQVLGRLRVPRLLQVLSFGPLGHSPHPHLLSTSQCYDHEL